MMTPERTHRFFVFFGMGFSSSLICPSTLLHPSMSCGAFIHGFIEECANTVIGSLGEEGANSFDSVGLPINSDSDVVLYAVFAFAASASIMEEGFSTDTTEGHQKFIKNLVGFYVIMEGIFFYSGFVMLLSFKRQNKMVGIGQQFEYIMRDESIHLNFGIDLINGIREENPEVWTPELEAEVRAMILKAVELEIAYAQDCMPRGILGLNAGLFREYVQYIADRRFDRLHMPQEFGSQNPFPWMSEVADLSKEANFFETKVTAYQNAGALEW